MLVTPRAVKTLFFIPLRKAEDRRNILNGAAFSRPETNERGL
jgi:hypothetical protein